ncbi:MAG: PAS domain S-box protein [Bacteroidales bacterium]|nr:PAS domain S-box protein [Bacteroidales bacterium]
MKRVLIYKTYERFWHWTQALLIFLLALTGFEIHGSCHLFGYHRAVMLHDNLAWAFIILIVFTFFWNVVTGEWKQYIPSVKLLKAQFEYYISGIFRHAPHPTRKTVYNKFNPLQRLTYFGLKIIIIPLMVISGLFYMYFSVLKNGPEVARLNYIAIIHVTVAFLLLGFVVGHVYLTTTGLKPLSAIKAMLTGWEDMSDEDAKTALEENLKVAVIKERKSILGPENTIQEQLFESTFEEVVQKLGIETESTRLREKLLDSNVGYFRINKEGFYEEVNQAWLSLYKCAFKDEIIGAHFSLNRPPDAVKKIETLINRVLNGESVSGEIVERVCKNGDTGYHTVSAIPYYKNGEIAGLEGFIIDVTEQIKAEQELQNRKQPGQSVDFYKKIASSGKVGYFRIDKDGFYQEVNDTWIKMYKYPAKEEIIGKHYSLSRTKEDFVQLQESVSRVLQGETIPFGLTQRYCKDGSTGYHTITMSPVYDGDLIIGFEGFIVDMTESVQAEQAMKKEIEERSRSGDFYNRISAAKGVGYFKIDKEGFYVDVNDNWLKLYRYNSKDEIIGKHYSLSRTKEDFVKLQEMVERVLHGEVIPFAKTRRHCKDGSIGYHNITMTPVIDGEDIVGFEGFITDIPDQKE